jgi:hypothetical protein
VKRSMDERSELRFVKEWHEWIATKRRFDDYSQGKNSRSLGMIGALVGWPGNRPNKAEQGQSTRYTPTFIFRYETSEYEGQGCCFHMSTSSAMLP